MTLFPWRLVLVASVLLSSIGACADTARAGFIHVDFQFPVAADPVMVGIDDGSGFVFATYFDTDGDGRIQIPEIAVGDRLALGVNVDPSVPDKSEECLIYTTVGTEVVLGATFIHPFLRNATGESVGAQFSHLDAPPVPLNAGDRIRISGGHIPGWNSIRLLNESGVPDFPTFAATAGTLPGFDGDVEVSAAYVRFHVVPEPTSLCLAVTGLAAIGVFGIGRTRHRKPLKGSEDRTTRRSRSVSRFIVRSVIVALPLMTVCAPADLMARGGGLRWGYVNEAQGYPLWNLWLMTNPWAQMSGWAIPHHSMAPNGLPPQYDNDGGTAPRSPYGNTWRTQPFDRSVAFTGSASQPSSYVPPNRFAPSAAAIGAPSVPTGPYRIDRSLYPPYYNNYNNYWHSGYWGGGLRGWAQWGKGLAERAFPRWSVGPLYYLSGYGQYRNPFVSLGGNPSAPHLDYRKPLVDFTADETPRSPSPKEGDSLDDRAAAAAEEAQRYQEAREFLVRSPQMTAGLKALDAAREAFRNKDYDTALRRTDEALEHLPRDSDFHEFRALVLFARGEYQQAAATIYAVLSVSPGWDWTTLSSMYADPDELTRQLRQLETYRKQHPDEAGASFLLAYHYMTCRHAASAIRQLRNVLRLIPDDNLVPPLIALFAGVDDSAAAAAQSPSADAAPGAAKPGTESGAELDPDQLAGEWKALRAGVPDVNLKLSDEGEFTWSVPGATPPRRYTGFYATKGERMTLISPRGQLPGKVTPREGGGFHFSLSENDPSDPGLTFGK